MIGGTIKPQSNAPSMHYKPITSSLNPSYSIFLCTCQEKQCGSVIKPLTVALFCVVKKRATSPEVSPPLACLPLPCRNYIITPYMQIYKQSHTHTHMHNTAGDCGDEDNLYNG